MTSNVELLPLYAELQGHPKLEIIKHYARAVAEHNVSRERDRAERLAEAGRRVTAAFRALGETTAWTRAAEQARHECEAAMLALDDALRDHDQEGGNP